MEIILCVGLRKFVYQLTIYRLTGKPFSSQLLFAAMSLTTHDYMITWVSLVHAGTYLPNVLSRHLQEELGISLAEQDFLKQLGAAGGELKLIDLSRRIYLSKAGVTKMMDRLESAGHVTRVRSETDRRVVNAKLTAVGRKVLDGSRKLLVAWVKTNLRDHLSEKQLVAMRDALETLLKEHHRWEGQMAHLKGKS